MPYAVNADLPPSIRSHLPEHAQDIFREAFNHAHAAHAHDPRAGGSRIPYRLGRGEAPVRKGGRRLGREAIAAEILNHNRSLPSPLGRDG